MSVVEKGVKSWNFVGDNDEVLPINEDSISLLTTRAFTELVCAITGRTMEELEAAGKAALAKKKAIQS